LRDDHVENPREVVSQGQPVNVKIIEVDGERRRLSLSLKRVEDTDPVQPRADGGESVHARPTIDLSEEVFAEAPVTEAPEEIDAPAEPAAALEEPEAVVEAVVEEPEAVVEEPEAIVEEPEAVAEEPEAVAEEPETPTAEADATGAGGVSVEPATGAAEPEAEAEPPTDEE